MVINIYTGNHFSQLALIYQTNKFLLNKSVILKKDFSSRYCNYTFQIKYKCITITLSEESNFEDYIFIKKYIEKLFKNKSIGIFSKNNIAFLNDVKNVTIYKNKI